MSSAGAPRARHRAPCSCAVEILDGQATTPNAQQAAIRAGCVARVPSDVNPNVCSSCRRIGVVDGNVRRTRPIGRPRSGGAGDRCVRECKISNPKTCYIRHTWPKCCARSPTRLNGDYRPHRLQSMNGGLVGMRAQIGDYCRPVVGVLAACALILQGLTFSITTARIAATTGPANVIPFETCLHDRGAGPKSPETPRTSDGEHCAFCLSGTAYALPAPPITPLGALLVSADVAWQPTAGWHSLPSATYCKAQPRGPPLSS